MQEDTVTHSQRCEGMVTAVVREQDIFGGVWAGGGGARPSGVVGGVGVCADGARKDGRPRLSKLYTHFFNKVRCVRHV